MATPQPAPSPWTNVPGALVQVCAASGGRAAGVNSAGGIYTYSPSTNGWTQINNPGTVRQVALAESGDLYGVDQSGTLWKWSSNGQGWRQLFTGSYQHVALAHDGTLFAATNNQVYNLGSGSPVQLGATVNGSIATLDVGWPTAVLIVNGNAIFKYNYTTRTWDTVPLDPGLQVRDVAIGYDGVMYALDVSQNIYRYVGQAGDPGRKNWLAVPGALAQIACYDGSDVWGVNRSDAIYRLRVDSSVTVNVTFDPNNKVTCAPDTVSVPFGKTYKIEWSVATAGHRNVSITGITFDNDPPFANLSGDFGPTAFVVDNDINVGNAARSFNYTLYLTADGQSYNSDPKIVNQSSGGGG